MSTLTHPRPSLHAHGSPASIARGVHPGRFAVVMGTTQHLIPRTLERRASHLTTKE